MHRLDAHNALLHQQQMLINSNNMYKPHLMPAQQTVSKDSQSKDKLFGRSSYHVAIAYHIHLKNIKESGANISVQSCLLDPTYYAKKLKGEYPDQAASWYWYVYLLAFYMNDNKYWFVLGDKKRKIFSLTYQWRDP